MPVVVGLQFKPVTKVYHFSPGELLDLTTSDYVIVDTSKGQEIAQVVQPPHRIADEEVVGEMKPVLRRALAWDLVQKDLWEHKEREALAVCRDKARESDLGIKIVRCEYNYNGGRLLIFFAAETRVDFRDLVRDLARIFDVHQSRARVRFHDLRVAADDREKVVEIVRDPAGQTTEGLHLLGLAQPRFELAALADVLGE